MSRSSDVTEICSDLIKIRSDNPPGYTDEVIAYIREFCDGIGLKTRTVTRGRRHNLLSAEPKGKLLLCGHVDVVPALDDSWTHPPYAGLIEDGFVHGRGSTDMKGGCAALLVALRNTIDTEGDPGVDIAFVADEEGKGEFGMEQLVEEGILKPCNAIIAEPTPSTTPIIGEKGILRTHLSFSGKSGHAALHPICGDSAIMQALKFLDACKTMHKQEWPIEPTIVHSIKSTSKALKVSTGLSESQAYKMLSRIMFNPGFIEGGERINVIAQKCDLLMDMRIPWGCKIEDITKLVQDAASSSKITILQAADASFSYPGMITYLLSSGISQVMHKKVQPGVSQAGSDARHLRKYGYEVVLYGPGDVRCLHSVDENVSIKRLIECQKVYEYVLSNISLIDKTTEVKTN